MNQKNNNGEVQMVVEHVGDAERIKQSLGLAAAQIELSLKEADHSVGFLIDSIISLANNLRHIQDLLEHVECDVPVQEECSLANKQIQQAIVAFQFYDRMSQRFSHIQESLSEMNAAISAPEDEQSILWLNLKERMRKVYSLEQEQIMYKTLLDGLPEDISERDTETEPQRAVGNEIELF